MKAQLGKRSEQRRSGRKPLHYPAAIVMADGRILHCMLSDISQSGARLTLSANETLSDEFTLVFARAPRLAGRRCRVVWREKCALGVQFLQRLAVSESVTQSAGA